MMTPKSVKWMLLGCIGFQLSVLAYNYAIGNINTLFAMLIASTLFTAIFTASVWKDLQ